MIYLSKIQELLSKRAELNARLNILPYKGTPDIKINSGEKYIYLRKREFGKMISTYVGKYNNELYSLVVQSSSEAKLLFKELRKIDKELALLGYKDNELSPRVILNLDFARANMKVSIYDQAVLEGVPTTFPQTETIIENGSVSGMKPTDIQKIVNLKHAWEFILNKDVLSTESDFYILSYIAKLVNEGFYEFGGQVRSVPVRIGGSSYLPPIPMEFEIKEGIKEILSKKDEVIDIAIELCLYCMKTQIFIDGNKKSAIIYANHYLISKGQGLLVIPNQNVSEFKSLLIKYYEGIDEESIKLFLKEKCWSVF